MLNLIVYASYLISIGVPPPTPEFAEPAPWKVISGCAEEYKVVEHHLRMVLMEPGAPIRPTVQLKCAVLCYMTSSDFMTPDGHIKLDELKANTTPAGKYVYDSIEQCKDTPGIDECDRAYQINYCIGMRIAEKNIGVTERNSMKK